MDDTASQDNSVELATELTIAWLSNPNTRANADEVPSFLRAMHEAVNGLSTSSDSDKQRTEAIYEPAVSVRKSLGSRDQIISLIDGKGYKTLKRHLSNHGLTPSQYRERYGLKADYPMVAPAYAERRRELAKSIGLGRKPRAASEKAEQPEQPKARRRRPKAAPKA